MKPEAKVCKNLSTLQEFYNVLHVLFGKPGLSFETSKPNLKKKKNQKNRHIAPLPPPPRAFFHLLRGAREASELLLQRRGEVLQRPNMALAPRRLGEGVQKGWENRSKPKQNMSKRPLLREKNTTKLHEGSDGKRSRVRLIDFFS